MGNKGQLRAPKTIVLIPDSRSEKTLHPLYILRPAPGTDRFLPRAFVDVVASDAPVLIPLQFIHVKICGATNGAHAASLP